jgi:hypothetical protein
VATRSSQLFAGNLGPGFTVPYTVPVGRRTILKSVQLYHAGSNTAVEGAVVPVSGGGGWYAARLINVAQGVQVEWNGWVVLEEGDGIAAVNNGSTSAEFFAWASGAELVA